MKKARKIQRYNAMDHSGSLISRRVCVSIPMTGLLRSEWVMARYGQTIPVNWSQGEIVQWFDTFSPLSYAVDDARNVAVQFAIENKFEWLLFVDHDVILPPDTFVKMNEYITDGTMPVVAGVYNAKGFPPEPLLFRGRGNSWYRKWKYGDKVWVDGVPMGCTLISVKLLKAMYDVSEEYSAQNAPHKKIRKVFFTPRQIAFDEKTGSYKFLSGTEDLWWCDRVIKEGWLKKTGFTKVSGREYPFLVDTSIKCGHIDPDGRIY